MRDVVGRVPEDLCVGRFTCFSLVLVLVLLGFDQEPLSGPESPHVPEESFRQHRQRGARDSIVPWEPGCHHQHP